MADTHTQMTEGSKGNYSVHCSCGWSSPFNPFPTKADADFEFRLHIGLKN